MGPHFAVVGPPLSGKTTSLYNWVLSLSYRYTPSQLKIVLVDLQQRFVLYGGEHRLDGLPHVITAVTEIEQIEEVVAQLKQECAAMAAEETDRELFVIIDNFDDFVDEVERMRDAARDLASMARRYGREGLHFIVAGSLDSASDLRRRVQASNYGIGLRSAQAVDTLRVTRRPAGLRGKELPVGRGFIVKSGLPTMVQMATPYKGMGVILAEDDSEEEEEKLALALDIWIQKIQEKYPDQQAQWAEASGEVLEEMTIAADAEIKPYIDMLRRLLYQQSNGDADQIVELEDAAILLEFAREALRESTGFDPYEMFGDKPKDILDNVDGMLPKLPQKSEKGE